MQPFIAAMLKVRQAFFAAIVRSLRRTKSLLRTILTFWISPLVIKGEDVAGAPITKRRREEFLEEVERVLRLEVDRERLLDISHGIKLQLKKSLQDHPLNMLPSYNHQLPTGDECGTYLALDVGGSTFRVALIELSGRKGDVPETKIMTSRSVKIDHAVRQLKGLAFFDWMAEKIEDALAGQSEGHDLKGAPLSAGLAWSFPIEQTSLKSGLLLNMGKGFLACQGLLGEDLGDLIQDACSRRSIKIQLNAIVNDSSATLLSKAYHDQTTRFALILGTGFNMAAYLPVHIFSSGKFGERPASWHDEAKSVIVNTELSMFGGGVLPFSRWDDQVNAAHSQPDFQPMEHFVSGGYIGEIVRLALVEGIETAGLFGGVVPASLKDGYSLDTETLSRMESDPSPNPSAARQIFLARHPMTYQPTVADMQALRFIASAVAHRASSIVAVGIHALWELRNETERLAATDDTREHTIVAYNGSVMENYPGFRTMTQAQLDGLIEASGGRPGSVELMYAEESSLVGAAVSVACLDG